MNVLVLFCNFNFRYFVSYNIFLDFDIRFFSNFFLRKCLNFSIVRTLNENHNTLSKIEHEPHTRDSNQQLITDTVNSLQNNLVLAKMHSKSWANLSTDFSFLTISRSSIYKLNIYWFFINRFDVFPLNRYVDRHIFEYVNHKFLGHVYRRETLITRYLDVEDDFGWIVIAGMMLPGTDSM